MLIVKHLLAIIEKLQSYKKKKKHISFLTK